MVFDVEYNHTGLNNFNLFETKGQGYGIDLGTSLIYKKKLFLDIGFVDIGVINFEKGITNLNSNSIVGFTGLSREEADNPEEFLDSIATSFEPDLQSKNSFKEPIGAKLSLMLSYKFGSNTKLSSDKVAYIYYRQGFSEASGVTITPKIYIAANHIMFNHLNIGLSTSWGGFNQFSVGGLIGANFKKFQFGIFSDDFAGFILPEKATGAGAGFLIRFKF